MANYGYSTPYHGLAGGALPSGYMEAATAPGRLFGQGIANLGQNIQSAIAQYQQKRREEDYLNAKIDAGLAQYAQAAVQGGGTMPNGDPADMATASRIIGEKNAKKLAEGNLSRAEKLSIAHTLETYGQTQLQALQRTQAELAVQQAKKAIAGEAEMTSALASALGVQPGTQPAVPYRSVTSELLSRYQNLSPNQQMALDAIVRQRTQPTIEQTATKFGLVPQEVSTGEKGVPEIKFGKPSSTAVTSQKIPGTEMVQTFVGDKPIGAPVKAEMSGQVATEYSKLPENLQKAADALSKDFRNEKTLQNVQIAGGFLNQMDSLGANIGTPKYKASDDIALIFSFMKTMDPGSTVREGEFATAQNAGGVPDKIINLYNRSLSGKFLNDQQRKDFINTAKSNYQGLQKEAEKTAKGYKQSAKDRGIPEYLVVPEGLFSMQQEAPKMQKFQSVADAESNMTPGQSAMVFNPQTGKYQQYIKR